MTGHQFLIEVKSTNGEASNNLKFRLRGKDLAAYRRYGALVQVPDLRVAIFWRACNMWTLTKPEHFTANSAGNLSIRFVDAIKVSDMASLGDAIIGTEFPLSFTLRTDPIAPPKIEDDGTCLITISDAFYCVGGKRVTASNEQRLVHFLMRYGGWPDEQHLEVSNGGLLGISFSAKPLDDQSHNEQGFAMHRALSAMYALRFDEETVTDGALIDIRSEIRTNDFPLLVPDDYEGGVLKCWRFLQTPADEA